MLIFDRKAFKSGVQVVKEPEGGGEHIYTFKPSDKGDQFAFIDEQYILAHYPVLFTVVPA